MKISASPSRKNYFLVSVDAGELRWNYHGVEKVLPYGTTIGVFGPRGVKVWMPSASAPRGYKDAARAALMNARSQHVGNKNPVRRRGNLVIVSGPHSHAYPARKTRVRRGNKNPNYTDIYARAVKDHTLIERFTRGVVLWQGPRGDWLITKDFRIVTSLGPGYDRFEALQAAAKVAGAKRKKRNTGMGVSDLVMTPAYGAFGGAIQEGKYSGGPMHWMRRGIRNPHIPPMGPFAGTDYIEKVVSQYQGTLAELSLLANDPNTGRVDWARRRGGDVLTAAFAVEKWLNDQANRAPARVRRKVRHYASEFARRTARAHAAYMALVGNKNPLVHGYSRKSIGKNIGRERLHGKSRAQSVRIAYEEARRVARKRLGYVPAALRNPLTKAELRAQMKAAGSHYWDRDTMRFFNSRLETNAYGPDSEGCYYFVTSEKFDDRSPRKYRVRRWKPGAQGVTTLTEVATKEAAVAFIKGGNKNPGVAARIYQGKRKVTVVVMGAGPKLITKHFPVRGPDYGNHSRHDAYIRAIEFAQHYGAPMKSISVHRMRAKNPHYRQSPPGAPSLAASRASNWRSLTTSFPGASVSAVTARGNPRVKEWGLYNAASFFRTKEEALQFIAEARRQSFNAGLRFRVKVRHLGRGYGKMYTVEREGGGLVKTNPSRKRRNAGGTSFWRATIYSPTGKPVHRQVIRNTRAGAVASARKLAQSNPKVALDGPFKSKPAC